MGCAGDVSGASQRTGYRLVLELDALSWRKHVLAKDQQTKRGDCDEANAARQDGTRRPAVGPDQPRR
jgi:hypothetical protein